MCKIVRFFILSMLCCLNLSIASYTSAQTSYKGSQDGYILLLNFYRGSNEWANAIENDIARHLIDTGKIFYLKNVFNATTDANKDNPDWWNVNFKDLPQGRPKLVVILSDAGWVLYRHYVPQQWKSIPCIILPARAYTVPFKSFSHQIEIGGQRMVRFEETMKGFRAMAVYHQHYVKQTIDLIHTLQPSINKVVLISDNRFSSAFVRYKMKDVMSKYFKNLKYITLNRKDYSTIQLLSKIQSFDVKTGIIFYGWYGDSINGENVDYTKKMISTYSKVPIFTLTDFETNKETSLCGGYYNSASDLSSAITTIIDKFEKKQSIPWGTIMDVNHPQKYLNYRSLIEKGISPDLIPTDAVIFGKPMSFYERHRHTVWIIGLLSLLVIYLIVRYIFTQRNLRHEREKEVMHLRRYEVLFNNMPISYLRYYVFRDDRDEFAYQLLNKNMACDKMFRDFEGNQNLSFIETLIFAEAEKDRIEAVANNGQSSLYLEVQSSESGKNYDVYICQSEKKSIIDIFIIDKTKQIEALHKMLKYARMNNRILEMLPDNIIIFRKDHAISKLINQSNDNSAFMLSEIINKTSTNPAFEKVRNQFDKAIDEAFATNELVTFDYQMQTANGIGYFKARLNTISNTQVCCNIHDYSEMMQDKIDVLNSKVELEHLNHKLQIVLDAAFVTPWSIDLKKQVVIVLDKEYKIEDLRKRVHPDDIRDYNDCLESLISNHKKQGIEPHNIRINFNGHRFHWYKMRCIVDSFDNQGNPAILIGSAEDIDKQKQIEDNLIEAKEKAEESNKLKSAFIANMSHEIRTPLNAIIGFSEVLSVSQTLSEEEKVLFRKNIATNKDLLMQLFSDILDLAKIDAGTIEFNYVEEDFTSIIKSVATSARLRENSNKDVKLVIEDVPDSCILFTDPHRVTQVITNFVNNAIKFTLAGTISIGYSITEDNMIYCHVTDTGIGIPKEHQPKIFERFVKLNSFKQGTGLGLSICKMIIEKMNGQIGVVSEQDKGSTFWFKIPILKEAPLMEEDE